MHPGHVVHEVARGVADIVALWAGPSVLAAVLHPHPQLVPAENSAYQRGLFLHTILRARETLSDMKEECGKWYWNWTHTLFIQYSLSLPVMLNQVALVWRSVGKSHVTYVAFIHHRQLPYGSGREGLPRRFALVENSLEQTLGMFY